MSCALYILRLKLKRHITEASSSSIADSLTQLSIVVGKLESYLEAADLVRAEAGVNDELSRWVLKVSECAYHIEKLVDINCCFHSSAGESEFLSSITKMLVPCMPLTEPILRGWAVLVKHFTDIPSERALGSFSKQVVKSHVPELIAEAMRMRLARNTLIHTASSLDARRIHAHGVARLEFDDLIGRDEEIKVIKKLIMQRDSTNNVEIVTLEGVAGIGKTALAKAVFNGVKGEFDCYAWVAFSDQTVSFLKDVIRGLLDSLSLIGPTNLDDVGSPARLEAMIGRCIDRKNFLLAVDDISSELETLESILDALPPNSQGKILLTSRSRRVVPRKTYCNHRLYKIKALESLDALELLRRSCKLGHVEAELWPRVKSIAEEIAEMCNYVPLAIKTIGGLLSTMQTESAWMNVKEKLSKSDALALCYAGMRPPLKICFLYASLFADRLEFSCKLLQRLWIAEDFIEAESNLTLEETAELRMVELIQRNLFHVVRVGWEGETITCSLLRPIGEFARRRCVEDRFISHIVGSETETDSSRCLAVHGDDVNLDALDLTGVRSLFLRNELRCHKILRSWKMGCKLLTVLELGHLPDPVIVNSLPDIFGNLVLLQYLGLRGTQVKSLPKSIGKLRRLQTLDVRETMITEMPREIEALNKLRHFFASSSFTDKVVTLPVDIDHFATIQTLAGVKLTKEMSKRLHQLCEVRKLAVGEVRCEHSDDLVKSIYRMGYLRSLTIKCAVGERFYITNPPDSPTFTLRKLRLGGPLHGLQHWEQSMKGSLKYLYLWDSQFPEDPFSILKHLISIVIISLCNVFNGERIRVEEAGFPNLRKLSIIHFNQLQEWGDIANGALQSLEELTVSNCRKLKTVPKGLESLSRLKVVHCSNVSKSFVQAANELYGREKKKITIDVAAEVDNF